MASQKVMEGFEPTVPERIPTPGTRKNSNPRYLEGFQPTVPEKEAKEIGCQPLLYVFIII